MSHFTSDRVKAYRLPPPWNWEGSHAIIWQAVLAFVFATTVLAVLHLVFPEGIAFGLECLQTWAHETSHYVAGVLGGGDGFDIVINRDGSGHAMVSKTTAFHSVAVSAAGLLGPAWLSALLLYLGITRSGNFLALLLFGIAVSMVTYFYVSDVAVMTALAAWAALALIAGSAPLGGFIKSTVVIFIGLALLLGVLNSADYAYLDFIAGDPNRPSDAQNIADTLGISDHTEAVGDALIFLMASGYVLATVFAANWFRIYGR